MLSPPYWILTENFPKASRIGKSFLVLLGCPSGRYYLGTTGGGGEGLQRNHHGRKSRDKIGGKVRWPIDVLCTTVTLFFNFVCLFVCLFFGCFVIAFFLSFFLSLFLFFHLFCDNLPCSGMFRNVGMAFRYGQNLQFTK